MDDIPPDILEVIFSFLSFGDVLKSARVCSAWQDIAYAESTWKKIIKLHFPSAELPSSTISAFKKKYQLEKNWREVFY